MGNWKYNNFLDEWINIDQYLAIAVSGDKNGYKVYGKYCNGLIYNLFHDDSRERCFLWMMEFMKP